MFLSIFLYLQGLIAASVLANPPQFRSSIQIIAAGAGAKDEVLQIYGLLYSVLLCREKWNCFFFVCVCVFFVAVFEKVDGAAAVVSTNENCSINRDAFLRV